MLTHTRFNIYLVLIFSDSKKAQVYKIPDRKNSHQEIEIPMSFDYSHLFGPDDGKADNGNFLFENELKKYIHVGEKISSFETDYAIKGYTVERGFNDVKVPFAHCKENI